MSGRFDVIDLRLIAARLAVLASCLAATQGAALAEPATQRGFTGPIVGCRFEAFSNDADDAGLPLRERPDRYAPILARLPPPVTVGFDEIGVMVLVAAHKDGWFRVERAWWGEEARAARVTTRPLFEGVGWAPATTLKAQLDAPTLRRAPFPEAPVVARLTGVRRDGAGGAFQVTPAQVGVRALIGCARAWVEVETEVGTGWIASVCGRQLGPCR